MLSLGAPATRCTMVQGLCVLRTHLGAPHQCPTSAAPPSRRSPQHVRSCEVHRAHCTGAITTLGRGGSDLTATLIGAALGVEEVQVWKDVDGEVLKHHQAWVDLALPAHLCWRSAAGYELLLSGNHALSNLNQFAVIIVLHGTNYTAGYQHQSAVC